jgi:hypothetical protein
MTDIVCEFCNRNFAQGKNLKKHYERCKNKPVFIQQQQYEKQIIFLKEEHEKQIIFLKEEHEKQNQSLKEQYEREIQNQREQYEREIQLQQRQLDKFETQLFEIAKQPKQITNHNNNSQNTNNRILNITNHLIPIETDEEIRKMIDNQYTRDIFLGGSESLKDMTVSILKDQETGKYRTVCSDASRSVFYYLDNENKLVKDIGMKNIHKKIQKPLFAATSLHYREIDQEGSIDDDKLCEIFSDNINFIDHELPNQLKPELQLPINHQE